MSWLERMIAGAVLSMSIALAGVGATYGQDRLARIEKGDEITQVRISDAAGRPAI
jgi:hypothetical protein